MPRASDSDRFPFEHLIMRCSNLFGVEQIATRARPAGQRLFEREKLRLKCFDSKASDANAVVQHCRIYRQFSRQISQVNHSMHF